MPSGTEKCPVCSTNLVNVAEKRVKRKLKAEPVPDDFLHREIPRVVLPSSKNACPLCALELKGSESKCPRCGVPLTPSVQAEGTQMLECPHCGNLAPLGSASCPACGVGFAQAPKIPAVPEHAPQRPEPVKPEPLPERPLPEVIAPVPPPQMPQNQGLVNGRGAVNGTGLVNGTGMTNGAKGLSSQSGRRRQRSFITRWQFLAILIAIAVVVPTFIYLSYSREATTFTIDGQFNDWSHVSMFSTYDKSGNSEIDVQEWAVAIENDRLYIYLETGSAIMGSTDVSSFYVFVDSDNSAATGYSASGLGADFMLEVDGWNGSIQSTSVSEYSSSSDKYDWNSWDSLGSMGASASGAQLEALAAMPMVLGESARFVMMSQNTQEQRSVGYSIPASGGILVIDQEPGSGIDANGIISSSANTNLLHLVISCEGASGTVSAISSSFVTAPLVSAIGDIVLKPGESRTVEVNVDTSQIPTGTTVSSHLTESAIDSSFSDVNILGEGVSAYVASAPSSIIIDGAFGDWTGKIASDSDSIGVQNPNIDIDSVGAVNESAASFFYVSVLGDMCSGSFVPALKEKPSGGGGGGVVIPPRKTGEDILYIYIDSDMSSSTGELLSISSKVIGADYRIEVTGINGNIVSQSLFAYTSGHWGYGSGLLSAAKDLRQLEVSLASSSIGGASSIDFIVETTDWRSRSDLATSVPQGTRAIPGGLPGGSIESWLVDGSTTSSSATAMSYQRKLFYDGVNYWSFFFDGANTVYKYSIDSGQTWTVGGQAFSTAGVAGASIWYDSPTSTLYIIGDTAAATRTVCVRQGTVSPTSHTINWSSNDNRPNVSSFTLASKNTYISRNSSGYLWMLTSNHTQNGPTRYQLSVFTSTAINSTAAWTHSGNMIGGSGDLGTNAKGSIVGIGSGATMLAVYGYSGNVSARTYTGIWSAETQIYAIGRDNPGNTDNAPPCVVVDGRGVAHVVYGDGHEQKPTSMSKPYIYYVYYNGAWSVPYRLDAVTQREGNFYPTISLDSATGNLFAFWVQVDLNGAQLSIVAKKNITGTWISLSLSSDVVNSKQYLNSIYSAPNEQMICWQWTQNTTGTIEVQFDKIPEFKEVVIPVVIMLCVFTVIQHRTRSRKSEA